MIRSMPPMRSPDLSAPVWRARAVALLLLAVSILPGCVRYSFTGASIPAEVETIYIPFFQDRSNGGVGNLSDLLYEQLLDRFVNQSRLLLADSPEGADARLEGEIITYRNQAFSVGGDEQTTRNQVQIVVRASFQYASEAAPVWSSSVTGSATYDVLNDPVNGELEAIDEAVEQIAEAMFNNSVSQW